MSPSPVTGAPARQGLFVRTATGRPVLVEPGPALLSSAADGPSLAAHRARCGTLPPLTVTELVGLTSTAEGEPGSHKDAVLFQVAPHLVLDGSLGEAWPVPQRLEVDWQACDACGLCAELLPETVALDEWGYPVALGEVPPEAVSAAREAVRACPRLALRLAG